MPNSRSDANDIGYVENVTDMIYDRIGELKWMKYKKYY